MHDASHLVGGQVDQDMRPAINGKVELFVEGGGGNGKGKGGGGGGRGVQATAEALSVGGTGQSRSILQRRGCRWWLLVVDVNSGRDHDFKVTSGEGQGVRVFRRREFKGGKDSSTEVPPSS